MPAAKISSGFAACLPVSQWMPVFPALYAFSSQTRSHPSFNGQVFMLTESPLLPKKWPPAIPLPAWSHMLFTKDCLLPSNPSMRRFIISVISAAIAQSYNKTSTSKTPEDIAYRLQPSGAFICKISRKCFPFFHPASQFMHFLQKFRMCQLFMRFILDNDVRILGIFPCPMHDLPNICCSMVIVQILVCFAIIL